MEQTTERLPRRDRERLARRGDILVAAQEVFAEKGYGQSTLEEIANKAEFGKGTLYNYFPDGKQEILLAIIEQFHDELCELISQTFSVSSSETFRTQLSQFLSSTFSFFLSRLELFMTLLREAHRIGFSDDPEPRKFFAAQRSRALDALSFPLQRAMDNGELRIMPPRLIAHMILVNINGIQMRACMDVGEDALEFPQTADAMAEMLTRWILDGIATETVTEEVIT
ncbi:MAG: TetR/AcrR family transcriptional regulator [Bacteroidetes bacterium]|nr:TetR/AcrR family transcriptional regulator [Bacteroidota bacterium]MDA1333889.1 TetR/AcrR family transcriptional regulator [Bacteroidota bacterium]